MTPEGHRSSEIIQNLSKTEPYAQPGLLLQEESDLLQHSFAFPNPPGKLLHLNEGPDVCSSSLKEVVYRCDFKFFYAVGSGGW
eukprot:CAMPEP_0184321238 /NCGR_PEP_ID=MMETSP1049-20130417/117978_1 /TAXON_ID=77928 /ORGANISM="Proteomonas sulcata, Strain CCMP704" /LENGTH=82 /DNA_ID=CAMNT_0026641969 /DNA_START=407 /DNA_END=655 /DNA_ORIENTATION=-